MLGALGAVTATAPAEALVTWIGWRDMFAILAPATVLCAVLVYAVVPEPAAAPAPRTAGPVGLAILRDRNFWRLAPLSSTCVGTAWSLQGLWASPWLADVEGFSRGEIDLLPKLVTRLPMDDQEPT
jgi:predicted MFS family arabinose efflux permease